MAIIGVPIFPVFLSKLNILTELADYSLPVLFIIFCVSDRGCGFCRHSDPDNPANRRNKHEPYRVSVSMKLPIMFLFAGIVILGVYSPVVCIICSSHCEQSGILRN